jgi:hypothetical protein
VALAYHRNFGEVTRGCLPDLLNAAHLKGGDRVLDTRHPMDGDWLPLSWSGADRVAGAVMDHVLWFNAA